MIEKLELKHLCGYLPYKLQCKYIHETMDGIDIKNKVFTLDSFVDHGVWKYWTHDQTFLKCGLVGKGFRSCDFKPLLLPLSALTEPMEDGSVPIVELAKMAYPKSNSIKINEDGMCIIGKFGNYDFSYIENSFSCWYKRYSADVRACFVQNQLQLFEYLYSKHFWLYDQTAFERGLIIDKRTIK